MLTLVALTRLLAPFRGTDDIGQANAELLVHHHYLAVRDQRAVDENIQRLSSEAIELDDRALIELEQLSNADLSPANLHRDGHRNIHHGFKIRRGRSCREAGIGHGGAELG